MTAFEAIAWIICGGAMAAVLALIGWGLCANASRIDDAQEAQDGHDIH